MTTELGNILLVEDDPQDVELTLDALGKHNFANEIVVVGDGEQALDYIYMRGVFAQRQPGDPVVILLDLKMPKVSGVEVARQMKADPKKRVIPIVILSSSRESRDLQACYAIGVNSYVVKPVEFKEFIDVMRQVGVFWALVNERPPDCDEV